VGVLCMIGLEPSKRAGVAPGLAERAGWLRYDQRGRASDRDGAPEAVQQ